MISVILKSILVGICLAAPIGPVIITILQKSLAYGRKVGFEAGLGCATMDTVYAMLSFVALAFISGFLNDNKTILAIVGASVVIAFGIMIFVSDPVREFRRERPSGFKAYWQMVGMILSNPGSILYDFAICSFFGLHARNSGLLLLAAGVFAGETIFWYVFTLIFGRLRNAFKERTLLLVSKLSGIALFVCGIFILIKGFI